MKQEIVAGIVLCVMGLCLLLAPSGKLWAVTEKWKSRGEGGPSKGYVVVMKVLGAVFAAVGAALLASGL